MPVSPQHAYLDPPDKVLKRLLKERNITEQYNHWTNLWMMMPAVAYRLATALTVAIPEPQRAGCLLGVSYAEGASVIDNWYGSNSTLFLVRDAVRKIFTRSLDAARYVVKVDQVEWEPRHHGPLSRLIEQFPDGVVTVHEREEGLGESLMDIHHLLETHVYCPKCELTLRSSYRSLMNLPGEA